MSINTINFVEGRLALVGKELSDLEGALRDFKKDGRFFDVIGEYSYYQSRMTKAEDGIDALSIEISTINMIEDYVRNNRSYNKKKVIPSIFDITDPTFSNLVSQYNQLLIKYENT
jgi:hypothetical protein